MYSRARFPTDTSIGEENEHDESKKLRQTGIGRDSGRAAGRSAEPPAARPESRPMPVCRSFFDSSCSFSSPILVSVGNRAREYISVHQHQQAHQNQEADAVFHDGTEQRALLPLSLIHI